jgi:hypothetical protein
MTRLIHTRLGATISSSMNRLFSTLCRIDTDGALKNRLFRLWRNSQRNNTSDWSDPLFRSFVFLFIYFPRLLLKTLYTIYGRHLCVHSDLLRGVVGRKPSSQIDGIVWNWQRIGKPKNKSYVAIFWDIAPCSPYVNRRFGERTKAYSQVSPSNG